MGNGPTFKIAGIPVQVSPTFLFIALFLGWSIHQDGLLIVWAVLVFVSVLAHELGHAFALRHYGRQPQILLHGMGGLTSAGDEPMSPRLDIVVTLAGPLTGLFLLGLPALYLAGSQEWSATGDAILRDAVFVNVGWSVLNLLPVLPLDGGRVASAILTLATGDRGQRLAHILSMVVAGAGGALALWLGDAFAALFAGFFFFMNLTSLRQPGAVAEGADAGLAGGWRSLARGDTRGAADAAKRSLSTRPEGPVQAEAAELLAWSHFCAGGAADARSALQHMPAGVQPSRSLRAALALDAGQRGEAVDLLVETYQHHEFGAYSRTMAEAMARTGLVDDVVERLTGPGGPGPGAVAELAVHLHGARRFDDATRAGERAFMAGAEQAGRVAYNLACSHAGAGQADAAMAWLARAADAGFADLTLLDQDPDLDIVRADRRFLAIRNRLAGGAPA